MMPAVMGSVLVGQVTDAFKEYSTVRLIGSPGWQIPVRIGEHGAPGLLIGGSAIRVDMIPQNKKIRPGDAVISASAELPYGLLIGTVESVRPDVSPGIFQNAIIRLSYDPADITALTIVLWTPNF